MLLTILNFDFESFDLKSNQTPDISECRGNCRYCFGFSGMQYPKNLQRGRMILG